MIFPARTQTVSAEIPATTASTTVISVPPGQVYTLLSSDLHQSSTGEDPAVKCGSTIQNKAYANADFQVSSVQLCSSDVVVISANSSGKLFYSISFVPYSMASSTVDSYVDNPTVDIALGFETFFLVFWLMVWLFRRK